MLNKMMKAGTPHPTWRLQIDDNNDCEDNDDNDANNDSNDNGDKNVDYKNYNDD